MTICTKKNGFWMLWELDSHSYKESAFPLPKGLDGKDGKDGINGKDGVDGKFTSEAFVGTLENDGVGIAPLGSAAPDGLQEKLDELKKEIIDGTTVVETDNQP